MASSYKTPYLSLNNWQGSDKPKRSDFVSDNVILDSSLGTHLNDNKRHLTEDERARLDSSFTVVTHSGTGTDTAAIKLPFSPKFLFIYKKGDSPTLYSGVNGYQMINSGYALQSGLASAGITLDGASLSLRQSKTTEFGLYYNLNSTYSQYIILLFR